jgi:hypothetical protein
LSRHVEDVWGKDVEEDVTWENGGKKETWKAKEEVVTGLGRGLESYAGWKVVGEVDE